MQWVHDKILHTDTFKLGLDARACTLIADCTLCCKAFVKESPI